MTNDHVTHCPPPNERRLTNIMLHTRHMTDLNRDAILNRWYISHPPTEEQPRPGDAVRTAPASEHASYRSASPSRTPNRSPTTDE